MQEVGSEIEYWQEKMDILNRNGKKEEGENSDIEWKVERKEIVRWKYWNGVGHGDMGIQKGGRNVWSEVRLFEKIRSGNEC